MAAADVEELKAVLQNKLSEEDLRLFGDADYVNLSSNGFFTAKSFEAATRDELKDALKEVLPGRAAIVVLLLKAFLPVPPGVRIGGSGSGPIRGLRESCHVYLLGLFGESLKIARRVPSSNQRREGNDLLLDSNGCLRFSQPGDYFSLEGRGLTLQKLVEGAAMVFKNFSSVDPKDHKVRMPHFNAIVGYPGAGKSSIGIEFPLILRRFWMGETFEGLNQTAKDYVKQILNEQDFLAYTTMIQNSWDFNAFMYHSVSDCNGGKLYPAEYALAAEQKFEQILALRCLHASTTTFAEQDCNAVENDYKKMLEQLRDYMGVIRFTDVLQFIREGLGITEKRLIFLSFFVDELNAAALIGSASWVQEMLSVYVQLFSELPKTQTFPLITVATTRHQSSSMMPTKSEKSQSNPIPINPLSVSQAETVVLKFMRRLANTVRPGSSEVPELSPYLKLCIKMTGGMPRLLSHMVRGTVFKHLSMELNAASLLKKLENFEYTDYKFTIDSLLVLAGWDDNKYSLDFGRSRHVLMSAVRASCLEQQELKGDVVHPSSPEITWAVLEERGLVSLNLQTFLPRRDPSKDDVKVVFPPVLLKHLITRHNSGLWSSFPDTMERGWRNKEESDLRFLLFMILLFKETHPERTTFRLKDIIPCTWNARSELKELEFDVPTVVDSSKVCQMRSPIRSAGVFRALEDWVVLGCGNNGLDSGIKLTRHQQEYLVVIQSKCSDDPKTVKTADASDIYWSCRGDVRGVIDLAGTETTSFGIRQELGISLGRKTIVTQDEREIPCEQFCLPVDRLVYIYNSDQEISVQERRRIIDEPNRLCSRIIISNHDGEVSPLDRLGNVRHYTKFKTL